jgi:hypothetical protein
MHGPYERFRLALDQAKSAEMHQVKETAAADPRPTGSPLALAVDAARVRGLRTVCLILPLLEEADGATYPGVHDVRRVTSGIDPALPPRDGW